MVAKHEQRSLTLDDKRIDYTLERTGRRKTVGIFVDPDSRVTVKAPADADIDRVEGILRRRSSWIRRQQREVEALPPPPTPREYVAGETHKYLGRQYRLKLEKSDEKSVKLMGAFFVVRTPDPSDRESVRKLMDAWYRSHAERLLVERMERMIDSTTWLDVEMPPLSVRPLRMRWGSTTSQGRITFNVDLVKLPLSCIDYVVAHELVHLKIPNHSPAFWRTLGRVMPDWRRWQSRLASVEV